MASNLADRIRQSLTTHGKAIAAHAFEHAIQASRECFMALYQDCLTNGETAIPMEFFDRHQVAKILDRGPKTIDQYQASGKLQKAPGSSPARYHVSELKRFLEEERRTKIPDMQKYVRERL